jgi:hypothetical protein
MDIVQDYSVLYNNAVRGRVCILLTHGKHLHGPEGRFELKKTGITPPLFIDVSVPSQESERSCICVLNRSILPLSTVFGI